MKTVRIDRRKHLAEQPTTELLALRRFAMHWRSPLGLTLTLALVIALVLVIQPRATNAAASRDWTASAGTGRYLGSRLGIGAGHSCFVPADGSVRCWGLNDFGQLGTGSTGGSSSSPVQVRQETGLTNAVAVAGGARHTCALRADGRVFCWGRNRDGELGIGSTGQTFNLPLPVSDATGLSDAVAVAAGAGGTHTCALRANGLVFCWGNNSTGQLGDGSLVDSNTPVQVTTSTGLINAVALSAGTKHTCASRTDGRVFCWGNNDAGQLGDGTSGGFSNTPVLVGGLTGGAFISLATGGAHTCAIRVDGTILYGTVFCWGDNSGGQLGNPNVAPAGINRPALVPFLTDAVSVTAGPGHTCATQVTGRVACWGANSQGQVGNGTLVNQPRPFAVSTGLSNVVAVGGGFRHTCASRADGGVFCWGRGAEGQLGSDIGSSTIPVRVTSIAGSISATMVVAGLSTTCAIRADGTAACWGENSFGKVGNGTAFNLQPLPVPVLTNVVGIGPLGPEKLKLTNTVALALGGSHTCALRADGDVFCWGLNSDGQLGIGTTGTSFLDVAPVDTPALTNAVAVTAGGDHTCALRADGRVFCWGSNASGQLGNGSSGGFSAGAVAVSTATGLTNVVAVAAGNRHNCALRADGRVFCWGRNSEDQLGNQNAGALSTTPVQVGGGVNNAMSVTAGGAHSCALFPTGHAACWGDMTFGQLGNGITGGSSNIPNSVAGNVFTFAALTAGGVNTCALLPDSRIFCWGDNRFGQLGQGDIGGVRNAPAVQVSTATGLRNAVALSAGAHACALRADGGVFCWGLNNSGQLGIGAIFDQFPVPVPVEVSSFRFNVDPVAEISRHGRVALVTALVNCPAGEHVDIIISLTQGEVVGNGQTFEACTGDLSAFPVTVHGTGHTRFVAGPARAEAQALIRRHRNVAETQEWTRDVELAVERRTGPSARSFPECLPGQGNHCGRTDR